MQDQKDFHPLFEQIADGLTEEGYAVVENFLSIGEVANILQSDEFRNGKLHFKKAGIGRLKERQINEAIRGDLIYWMDPATSSASIQIYFSRIDALIQYLNQSLFLGAKAAEIHLTVYPVGAFYKRHLDQFKSDDHRKLSIICYLNEDWRAEHGGQLRLYLQSGHSEVLPLAGRLVCFRSDQVEHEVLPGTRERLSLTGWIVDRALI